MDLSPLGVRATAGTLRAAEGIVLAHAWTDEGVVAGPVTNGAQLLHLSVALCVLNDTYREAQTLGIEVDGVAVTADGGFDDDWRSTGVRHAVHLDVRASAADRTRLVERVDAVAETPRALRQGAPVLRTSVGGPL
ncbi:osmotically inducible protein OsmC [Serinicoccus chungangensis]|uniref:Osmotically inducible protein OsmC n=1 Tax=Serinicoccus chungangensis TaxID=767452 RepID=A0A0W8I2G6_9MICO|nr:OsmC family protein [Serinicoccus chungangensis]KUG51933.1 osmotically inducible protein OsmC [Serinicoccus chungangensis]